MKTGTKIAAKLNAIAGAEEYTVDRDLGYQVRLLHQGGPIVTWYEQGGEQDYVIVAGSRYSWARRGRSGGMFKTIKGSINWAGVHKSVTRRAAEIAEGRAEAEKSRSARREAYTSLVKAALNAGLAAPPREEDDHPVSATFEHGPFSVSFYLNPDGTVDPAEVEVSIGRMAGKNEMTPMLVFKQVAAMTQALSKVRP
jgi:hypothetical protein